MINVAPAVSTPDTEALMSFPTIATRSVQWMEEDIVIIGDFVTSTDDIMTTDLPDGLSKCVTYKVNTNLIYACVMMILSLILHIS